MANTAMTFRYDRREMTETDLNGYYNMIDFDADGLSRNTYTQLDIVQDIEFFTEEFGSEDVATEYVLNRIVTTSITINGSSDEEGAYEN